MDKKKTGKKLVRLRGCRTQEEVAENIGISKSALSMYENGNRMPKDKIKIRLARYYEVPVEELFLPR